MDRGLCIGIDATQAPLRISAFVGRRSSDAKIQSEWIEDLAFVKSAPASPFCRAVPVENLDEFQAGKTLVENSVPNHQSLVGTLRQFLKQYQSSAPIESIGIAHPAMLAPAAVMHLIQMIKRMKSEHLDRVEVVPIAAPLAMSYNEFEGNALVDQNFSTVISCTCGLTLNSGGMQSSSAMEWLQVTRKAEAGGFHYSPDWFCSDLGDLVEESKFDSDRLTKHLTHLSSATHVVCSNDSGVAAIEARRKQSNREGAAAPKTDRKDEWGVSRGAARFASRASELSGRLVERIPIILGAVGEISIGEPPVGQSVWREVVEDPEWALEVNRSMINLAALHGFKSSNAMSDDRKENPRWKRIGHGELQLVCYDTVKDETVRGISDRRHRASYPELVGNIRGWSQQVPIIRPVGDSGLPTV